MKADALRAGRGLLADPQVARDPAAGRGIRLDETGIVPASVLRGGTPGTTLPPAPTEGQQTLLTDSLTAPTYAWLLQWSVKASKWLFIGGSPATASVVTAQTTTSLTLADLATVGPSFTVPRAGSYLIEAFVGTNTSSSGIRTLIGYKVGGGAATDWFEGTSVDTAGRPSVANAIVLTAAASDLIKLMYRVVSAGTGSFNNRVLKITPVSLT